jgi:hypothetical protein
MPIHNLMIKYQAYLTYIHEHNSIVVDNKSYSMAKQNGRPTTAISQNGIGGRARIDTQDRRGSCGRRQGTEIMVLASQSSGPIGSIRGN